MGFEEDEHSGLSEQTAVARNTESLVADVTDDVVLDLEDGVTRYTAVARLHVVVPTDVGRRARGSGTVGTDAFDCGHNLVFHHDVERSVELRGVSTASPDRRERFGQAQRPIEAGATERSVALGTPNREVPTGQLRVALEDGLAATEFTRLVVRDGVEYEFVGERAGEDGADHTLALPSEHVPVCDVVDEPTEEGLEVVVELRAVPHPEGLP